MVTVRAKTAPRIEYVTVYTALLGPRCYSRMTWPTRIVGTAGRWDKEDGAQRRGHGRDRQNAMPLAKIKVDRLYKQIAQALIAHMESGAFRPGQALPAERELAKQLGVSRTSVREALIFLEIEGRVDIRTGQGVYVRDPALSSTPAPDIHGVSAEELLAAREVVEGRTAELAALNGSDAQKAALRQITEAFDDHPVSTEAFLAHDKRFHLLIAAMSGNRVLRQVVEFLWTTRDDAMFRHLEAKYAEDELPLLLNEDHRRIAEAILAGDAAAAAARMRRHLQNVHAHLFEKAATMAPQPARERT
ncbi:FadR/GntR family transcriptional regulator [Roseixanthobacter glucoisosaccharinicivorans]|uniref:FadR/GntR family transcriptional regulator n=1 Tax=Roseixanthobacter glucoisosaccharinicivorans TaxID=3119923 RepID=UPI00372CCABA